MTNEKKLDALRRETSPLFNDRKIKLGTFSSNLSYGCAITTIDGTLEVTWPNTLTLAQLAEDMDFEALVPGGGSAARPISTAPVSSAFPGPPGSAP
jgi:dimethylsulfone monooxygenase